MLHTISRTVFKDNQTAMFARKDRIRVAQLWRDKYRARCQSIVHKRPHMAVL